MGLHAHLIRYYFAIAALSAETAGGFPGPLSRMPLFATSAGSLGRIVFSLCHCMLLYHSCSKEDIFVLIASTYKVARHNCPSASISL